MKEKNLALFRKCWPFPLVSGRSFLYSWNVLPDRKIFVLGLVLTTCVRVRPNHSLTVSELIPEINSVTVGGDLGQI